MLIQLGKNCWLFIDYVFYQDEWRLEFTKNTHEHEKYSVKDYDQDFDYLEKIKFKTREGLMHFINGYLKGKQLVPTWD